MTKSIAPSSFTHLSAASCNASGFLTSTLPNPNTLAPFLAVAISFAIFSVFSTLRPMIQALAPRWTIARTWAEQIVPAPPVQKTTLLSDGERWRHQHRQYKYTSRDEIDRRGSNASQSSYRNGEHTKDAILPHFAQIFVLGKRHCSRRAPRFVSCRLSQRSTGYSGKVSGCTVQIGGSTGIEVV